MPSLAVDSFQFVWTHFSRLPFAKIRLNKFLINSRYFIILLFGFEPESIIGKSTKFENWKHRQFYWFHSTNTLIKWLLLPHWTGEGCMGDMGIIFLFKNHYSLYQILENHFIKQKSSVKWYCETILLWTAINLRRIRVEHAYMCTVHFLHVYPRVNYFLPAFNF